MKNVFDPEVSKELISRINSLTPDTSNQWGRMNVGQMLAHCNVTYDLVYTDKYPKPKGFKKFMIKLLAKKVVTGPKPYKKNMRTSPLFLITDERSFETEKQRLIQYIDKTQKLGATHFHNKESHAFGPLTTSEWNVLFYKHLDHHLRQFGS
ncbi:DUF1569 domain-containing protein [Pseudozobellia thermophila]|uniref:DUF1569 domain-containing protein n=1 Tax=Pseudozobellia thermophila TaxID=192903 RepID=A0A1M6HY69_9FLAO|nr:DUF1569 domain-containing protein [Pseudozobellia thermophila]SHJ27077.1 Protein of unknown function [Pseudozobellia thermophila]